MKHVEGKELTYCFENDENYILYPADLETDFFNTINADKTLPTLFLSDVVVSYLESDNTVELVKNLKKYFTNITVLFFEMINPHDAFGD